MFGKIGAFWNVFRQGQVVSSPAAWKKGQVTVTMVGGLIIAVVQLAKVFGYEVYVDEDTVSAVSGGVIAIVNWLLTYATTDKIGLPSKPAPEPMPEAPRYTDAKNVSTIDDATRRRAEEFIRDTYKG